MSRPIRFPTAEDFWIRRVPLPMRCELLDEGADIVDIGGESTRPGSPVAA